VLTRGRQILFARSIPIGGAHFTTAVSQAMKISFEEAMALRIKLGIAATQQAAASRTQLQPSATAEPVVKLVEDSCAPLLSKLVTELDLCRRYYEATFPAKPVDRLVFIGGEARQRWLCQQVARELGVAAQVGDPMCRMNKWCELGAESGIDRRVPQPHWVVAIGLSMGPPAAKEEVTQQESRSVNERTQSA
jgi:Tfp pilus assembly PilM family ATPase